MQLLNLHNELVRASRRWLERASDGRASSSSDAPRRRRRAALLAALATGLAGAGAVATAHAGYITQPEYELDRIFSQASFGAQGIDVRFNPGQTLYSTALASVDSGDDVGALFARATSPETIYAFYVDTVNWCGSYSTSIIGCGELPGNAVVLESKWAASSYGATLIAHEGAHNLGLDHSSSSDNLMYGTLTGATTLSTGQVSTILDSPLVQWRDGLRTLSITPIAVVASGAVAAAGVASTVSGADANAVPEPAGLALAALSLALAGILARRRAPA